jgi:hypothetical protein
MSYDANGWTVLTPNGAPQDGYRTGPPASGSTMVLYASSSTGKDPSDPGFVAATQGSIATPYRTPTAALSVMRDLQPDWLLLKKGDIWAPANYQIFTSGLSPTEPMVISCYDPSQSMVANPYITASTISGLTITGSSAPYTVQVTTSSPHLLTNALVYYISIRGATPFVAVDQTNFRATGYDGDWECTVTGASTFTYQINVNPGTPGFSSATWQLARPFLKVQAQWQNSVGAGFETVITSDPLPGNNIIFYGLDFYAYTKDPLSPDYGGSAHDGDGIPAFITEVCPTWTTFEDCRVAFFHKGMIIETPQNYLTSGLVTIHRCSITDSFPGPTGEQGIAGVLTGRINQVFTENTFDHNGWNNIVTPLGPAPGCGSSILAAGFMPSGAQSGIFSGSMVSIANFTGNLFSNTGGNEVIGCSAVLNNNLFFTSPASLVVNNPLESGSFITNNVCLTNYAGAAAYGQGLTSAGTNFDTNDNCVAGPSMFFTNILANANVNSVIGFLVGTGAIDNVFHSNIVFNWNQQVPANVIDDTGTGTIKLNNFFDSLGANSGHFSVDGNGNATSIPSGGTSITPWPNPTYAVENYDSNVLGGPGTQAHFLARVRLQNKNSWNTALLPVAVNNYIRNTGFGLATTVPTVTGISPTSGSIAGGTSVTITGTNLTAATAVYFGTTAASFIVNSGTQITATSPASIGGPFDIRVVTPQGTSAISAADVFTYNGATPTVTSVVPATGTYQGFQWVKILGTDLFGATAVQIGAQQALAFQSISDTQVNFVTPAVALGTGTVDSTVTTPSGTSGTGSADHFTYVDQVIPDVTVLSPTGGPVGTTINIGGVGFTNATLINFTGAGPAVTWTVLSDISATAVAIAPLQFSNGYYVTVITPAGSSTAHLGVNNFTVTSSPAEVPLRFGMHR